MASKNLVGRKALLDALETVTPALMPKSPVFMERAFIFKAGNVIVDNGRMFIRKPIPELDLNIEGAVLAEGMVKTIRLLKDDNVDITTDGYREKGTTVNQLVMTAGTFTGGVPFGDMSTFEEAPDPETWISIDPEIRKAVSFALDTVDTNENQGFTANLCIDFKQSRVETTDDARASIIEFPKVDVPDGIPRVLLPKSSASLIVGFPFSEVGFANNRMYFKCDDSTVLGCTLAEHIWPPVESLMDKEFPYELEWPKLSPEVIKRLDIFAEKSADSAPLVSVGISNEHGLSFSAVGTLGWAEENIADIKWEKDDLTFRVQTGFLSRLIKSSIGGKCRLNDTTILFEGSDWRHIVSIVAPETEEDE